MSGLRSLLTWRAALATGAVPALAGAGFAAWQYVTAPSAADQAVAEAGRARGGRSAPDAGTAVQSRFVLVYVSGAVAKPGLYRLAAGLRVTDAVAAAGGLLADADPDKLPNLASRLSDGKEVKVPRRSARGRGSTSGSTTIRVDINSADVAELMTVPGIDRELAQNIVAFRDAYGGFTSLNDLNTLMGLELAYVARLRRYLVVGD